MFWKARSFINAQSRTLLWKKYLSDIYTDYDSLENIYILYENGENFP